MIRPEASAGGFERKHNVVAINSNFSIGAGGEGHKSEELDVLARQRFMQQFVFPKRAMGQYNFSTWLRFLLATGKLNDFETAVISSVSKQQGSPSTKQRQVLWRAMFRIFPSGCGKWGKP